VKSVAAALALLVAPQNLAPPQPADMTFRSGVEVVPIDVSVSRRGSPVQGLAARDFVIFDNGVEQQVDSVTLDDHLPLDVQLVLDASGSVSGDRLTHLIAASGGLLRALRGGDRVGLLTFSDVLEVRTPLTDDFPAVSRMLSTLKGDGQTALRDAVELALALRRNGPARPLMILFTDGVDNASWLSDESVIDSARRAGTVIQVVGVPSREFSSANLVQRLTQATGGRVWSASSSSDLDYLFTKAVNDMRARYLLTFTPRGAARPGWHQLQVKLRDGRADVIARPGYFVATR